MKKHDTSDSRDLMKKRLSIVVLLLCTLSTTNLLADEIRCLKSNYVAVFFEPSLETAAKEVAEIYPEVKAQLENSLGWDLNLTPSVLLFKHTENFQRIAESPLTVAFAVPAKSLVVIDYSRMNIHPFTLENTLKHEICHLLLHHHIKTPVLPRWLDEGVCQWLSDGIGDIIMDQKRSFLNKAALSRRLIPLRTLEKSFPQKENSLILAYEESKGFVTHITSQFGREGILKVLNLMKKGHDADAAILKALSIPTQELEKEWHDSLKSKITWFTHLSYHLYDILFALMGLITIWAFIRLIIKKRALRNEEMDETDFVA
jgi:hypothetical protein